MRIITEKQYNELLDAKRRLCNYCENDECEKCIVTLLIDQATSEAIEAGIIEED